MIAITGAAGFIGSVLAWKLNSIGQKDLLLVDQKSPSNTRGMSHDGGKWANIEKKSFTGYMESGDLLTRLDNNELKGKISALFHLGACSDTTEMDVEFLRKNNSEYSEKLAAWCLANKVYFCYASSAATYGNGELGFSDNDTLTPKLKPLNPYGQSKLDFDKWVLKNHVQDQVVGLRYFNVYGPNEYHKGHMRSLVHKGFEQVQKEGKLRLFKSYTKEYSDGGQKRDFIYVKDAVDAMIWLYENQKVKGIFNLGTGRAQTWNDLANALFAACGKKPNIEYIDMPDNIKNQYQYFTEADMTKLKQAGCPTKFRGLNEAVKDYVQNHLLQKTPYL